MLERIDNTWRGGKVNLVYLPLKPGDTGSTVARFAAAIIDPRIADEWYLELLDDPAWAERYGQIKELSGFSRPRRVGSDC